MNRVEINHLSREDTRNIGLPSLVVMRVRCDEPGCKALSQNGEYADNDADLFAKTFARGNAEREGWQIGEYSTGKADYCPAHRKDQP